MAPAVLHQPPPEMVQLLQRFNLPLRSDATGGLNLYVPEWQEALNNSKELQERFIELDDDVWIVHVEIGRRIVKGEVAILPDAGEGHIDRVRLDQLPDPGDLRREIGRIPLDEMEAPIVGSFDVNRSRR